MKVRIRNLTPHAIVLAGPAGRTTVAPDPAGPARVAAAPGCLLSGGDGLVALYSAPTWGDVIGLPPPEEGVILVVSALVAGRCGDRGDVFSPGTGPADGAIRGPGGQIEAVTRLVRAR